MRSLVIDDEYVALTKMTSILAELGECDAATNGKQAFEMFMQAASAQKPYHLVTMDIQMPELDGLALLERIRDMEDRRRMKPATIIMVSVAGTPQNVVEAARHRCSAFLVKPVKRDSLMQKLAELGLTQL